MTVPVVCCHVGVAALGDGGLGTAPEVKYVVSKYCEDIWISSGNKISDEDFINSRYLRRFKNKK